MPNDLQDTATPAAPKLAAIRKCPGCGVQFPAGGRGMGKSFHSDECRKAFHNVHRKEGFPLAPLVKAWHSTRHAKPGSREAEICTFARNQLTQIARDFLDADEEDGRDVVAYVGTLMDSGILYADRQAWSGR
jgi:hypothetical protein